MMDSYLSLQEKTRIVFYSMHFFQFIVLNTHETKLLRLLHLLTAVILSKTMFKRSNGFKKYQYQYKHYVHYDYLSAILLTSIGQ